MSLERLRNLNRRFQRRNKIAKIPLIRLRDRANPMEDFTEVQFKTRFHMHKATVHYICSLISGDLSAPIRRGTYLPPILQLCIAIRFYCTGIFQHVNCDLHAISQPTVSNVVKRVSLAIAKLRPQFIKFPSFQEAQKIREGFYKIARFPGIIRTF